MTMFTYNVYFHVAENEITKQHNDEMTVIADCLENARYTAIKRIQNEFDYPASAVDKISIYNKDYKLLKTYERW